MRRPGSRNPGARALAWIAVGLGLVFVWAAYELGQSNAGHNRLAAIKRESQLRGELLAAEKNSRALSERVAVLETGVKVSAEAYRQVEDQLGDLQARIQQQSEDIAFYRGIVGADQQAGLRVQDLQILAGAEPGSYSLRLVLAQALRSDQRISGQLELQVDGERDGKPLSYDLKALTGSDSARLDFSFRYFQNLQADVTMPADFDPGSITVRLLPRGKNQKDVEESFDWLPAAG